jgi:Family of unknown function (DUF5677)
VGYEVLTLLSAGFADGAMARWRTLHEIAVTAMFVQERGEAVAERYPLHRIIESRKAALQFQQYARRLRERPYTAKQMAAIEREYDAVIGRFGKSFREDFGWAAETLKNERPNFSQIEAGTKFDHWRPYYKLASHNVHGNPKGIYFRLGLISGADPLVAIYIKKLGFQQAFTWGEPPTFAGVNLGNVQIFLQKGTPTPSSEAGAVYFIVGDADQLYEFHRATGVEIAQAIDDRPYGITCSTPARASRLSGSTCRCVWRNVSRHSSKISPNTSA